ncbi:MAG: hypothetical protein GXY68_08155 [Chloroflexi bacterium]|jgi:hypothetical protein|nr:hypothetical protein [Chloroflexota bacterium]
MKRVSDRTWWGIALIGVGALLLLRNMMGGWFDREELLIGGLFAAAGVGFVVTYASNTKQRWWAIIPGCTLLGLGALLTMSSLSNRLTGLIGGPVFLLAIALSFLIVFLSEPTRWWAIIPAGATAAAGATALVEALRLPFEGGAVMMFGLAATFGLLALVETPQGRMRWPLIPAGVLAAVGLLILSQSLRLGGLIWPIALVLAGAVFVLRSLKDTPKE